MSLRINDMAPDFSADTTDGPITSMNGLGTVTRFSSLIPKTSPRSARLNWE